MTGGCELCDSSRMNIQSVKGMNDTLPSEVGEWQRVEAAIRDVTRAYGYGEIRTPILESTDLFLRSIGDQTDIVQKEMYTFVDQGGGSLTLRPEQTAGCVRAGVQHGLFHNKQARMWYYGPMFRRERPQRGRFRQFYQFGVEGFGWPGPDLDAELLLLCRRLWRALGVDDVKLHLNSLGSTAVLERYRGQLVEYFTAHEHELDEDSARRLQTNPLRILDSKNPKLAPLIASAPSIIACFDAAEREHFDGLRRRLDQADIDYVIDSSLVRGLDYYTSTVFEWTTDKLGAQSAVCGGGRYDDLVESLGGKPTPAAGFALGVERLIELVRLADSNPPAPGPDVYLVGLGDSGSLSALVVAETLRDRGLEVVNHCGGGDLKRQLRQADRSGARFAVIIGEDELAAGKVTLKSLRDASPQVSVAGDDIGQILCERLESAP